MIPKIKGEINYLIANFELLVFLYFRIFCLNFFSLNHKMYWNYLVSFTILCFILIFMVSPCRERGMLKHCYLYFKNSTEAIYDLLIYSIALLLFDLVYWFLWWINVTGHFFYKRILVRWPAEWREIHPF